MKVALVHDWLTGMRGGERVLERLCALFPDAPIHTLVWKRGAMSDAIEAHPIRTSFVQVLPAASWAYRWYLPVFPSAIERFDFAGYDVVISSSHCVAKSVRVGGDTFHLSYIHTPMRYVYELESTYFPPGRFPQPVEGLLRRELARLRAWDIATRDRPHALVANSQHVADRISRHWGRSADVVHPPVDVGRFRHEELRAAGAVGAAETGAGPAEAKGGDSGTIGREFYLLAGAFAPYKRGELAIEACARLGRRLLVVGSGQDERALRRAAHGDIEFIGWASDAHLTELYRRARALIFPGEEDFGIVPVEAMASGCPVIAYGRGGALETVGRGAAASDLDRVTHGGVAVVPGGVLFGEQSVGGVMDGIRALEAAPFDRAAMPARAEFFAVERFDREFMAAFTRRHEAWRRSR